MGAYTWALDPETVLLTPRTSVCLNRGDLHREGKAEIKSIALIFSIHNYCARSEISLLPKIAMRLIKPRNSEIFSKMDRPESYFASFYLQAMKNLEVCCVVTVTELEVEFYSP